MIYDRIQNRVKNKEKIFALLLDPEEYNPESLAEILKDDGSTVADIILVGGSLVSKSVSAFIESIKEITSIPVLLFPGSLLQISDNADGILFSSLISGRNPNLLIDNHVAAAPFLKNAGIEVISTGYIILEDEKTSSVEYISNTKPIPADKTDIVVATAIAGEMLGFKLIYLEAGSGARQHVKTDIVKKVKKNINIPLMVGGGIRTSADAKNILKAGADIIVVGNAIEKDTSFLSNISKVVKNYN